MPVRSANTRQARCSCTSGPAPWNPCHHLGDIDAVVPGPDHGLEPTRRDDAGVHIDPGVRVDKGLITFHHERLEERNGRERGGHTLDEVDGVLPSPPFQDVALGGLGDLASASHRRVEPSMSVNKNVLTREGAAARSANTPAESHNRHAPTWHFAGIRPRCVTNTLNGNAQRPTPAACRLRARIPTGRRAGSRRPRW
jgi:hypothetical protein